MSQTYTSVVLYNDKEANQLLRETCRRTFEAGGKFTMRTYYDGNWYVEYAITPAEEVKCTT